MSTYVFIAEALFFAFVILTFMGAILAVRARLLMHAVLGLAVCLLGVAGLYFYLGSIFLTMMQILIYVGAICILMVFGVMVGYTPQEIAESNFKGKNRFLAVAASFTGFFLLLIPLLRATFTPALEKTGDFSLPWLGETLLYRYCMAFELISVVLLAAIIGAIILATGGRES
ncbi:NADH dehydrogenase subunit J [Desulfobotulus alkaliphilus]|uniref:NADH-quinone oxidoreductase subunit J n=1 Tax=Desulfobotulus alkaliphilus TaxID=622671 RepID=A0A562RVZ0_9BACT|nr:NADH-quinone oxidoreductase subunit J [Desulfobotulus alkaliphilus]TWI73242.1 NADH dehydrogenase subunit J [Desulfobotulus alkaliphilus]